jgi:Gelsolin repeat
VLLSTSQQGTSPAFVHEIHFWIGKECSQDEAAGAAMLAVQLDNALSTRGSDAAISRYSFQSPLYSYILNVSTV